MDAKTCPRSALLVARLTDGRNSMHRGLDLWGIVIVKGSRCRFSSAGRATDLSSVGLPYESDKRHHFITATLRASMKMMALAIPICVLVLSDTNPRETLS